jgi:hypothetical protein
VALAAALVIRRADLVLGYPQRAHLLVRVCLGHVLLFAGDAPGVLDRFGGDR